MIRWAHLELVLLERQLKIVVVDHQLCGAVGHACVGGFVALGCRCELRLLDLQLNLRLESFDLHCSCRDLDHGVNITQLEIIFVAVFS